MTSRRTFPAFLLVALALLLATASPLAAQCVSLTTLGSASTQNFDTLSNTAGSTTNNLTITGWFMTETGGGARDNEQYAVDTGGSNTGDTFSYGLAGNTNRALGGLQSGTLIPVIGACFTNNTGATIGALDIAYFGEQWRVGNNAAARDDQLDFQYSLNATSLTTGAWTDHNPLDFVNVVKTGTVGALNGDLGANRLNVVSSIPALSIPNGATFWIRWNDLNASGADDGLAVDDFGLTPQSTVVLPQLSISDVSQAETSAGTTTFTFAVTLNAPAGPGGVTFDIATADGTAQDDNPAVTEDNDYVDQALTGQNIPAGSTGPYNFSVTVNGDVVPEANETFFVNVTNVTGATVNDGQGQGTIQNDDAACADLTISDVTQNEGNGGTSTFAFTVSLSQAGCGTVTFDIATADGTAQDDNPATEDNDYVPQSLTGQTITFPATYTFNVTVNGDLTQEPDQTFFVNITNVSPGNVQVADGQGLGTIVNDDFTRIHDVQGNGTASPLVGQTVTLRGIVTLLKSNGFFLQEELADYDADPNTSEGIFVFTSTAPTVAVGNDASVTGTVVEFNDLTEISPVTSVTTNSTGNTLPTAVTLTALDLPPAGGPTQPQLEKYEGMRLFAPSLVTVAPNDSFFDVETVLTPQPRPFREPGIPASDPIPPDPTSGLPDPNIPIWDENPERLNVDTNGRAGSTGETLTSNVTLTNVAGPLDFAFGRYRLINEANLTRTADMSAVPVPVPAANEFTIAGYNIENFNNNATQRQKAALTIRDVLRLPDIIGTVEIFDLADLQALATEIQTISGVTYSAHLIEQDGTSEDSDQDVGFLIKTSRVSVTSVTAERTADTFINPNTGLPELLHDRPPLLLTGTVDPSGPSPLPVFVIVNHLRSFIDVELVAGEGPRVRAKRKAQAESLADLLNDLQTANPGTPVISVGDYNAFQFNSGYDDSLSVLKGTPTPDDQIVVDQSPDLLTPDYSNLFEDVPAAQRYSFVFEGTPQSLDHMLVNTAADALNTGIAVARVNADFPEVSAAVYASNPARPERNSDHDPVVGYFLIAAPDADVSITKTLDTAGPYFHGQSVTYTLTVANAGPSTATNIDVTDTPTNLTITGVSGACASLPCTIASLASGASTNITVTATINAPGAFDNSADANADEADPSSANNTDNTGNGGTAAASANVSVSKTLDTAGPYFVGQSVTYTITVANAGPSTATNVSVTDTPSNLTITGVSGACASFSPCTIASIASGANAVITVTATIDAAGAFDNAASATAAENDPNTADNTDNTGNGGTATASADLSITKTDSPDPVDAGSNLTYQITLTNNGPSSAASATFSDPLPAGTTFVSLSTTGGWSCTTPAVGATGTVSCTNTSFPVTADFFTLVVNVDPAVATGTVLSNTATIASATTDPNGGNESATAMTTVATSADLQITKTDSPDPVTAGSNLTYQITLTNNGPSNAASAAFSDPLPAGTTFVSLSTTGSWSCTTPAVGATGTVSCTNTSFLATVDFFTLVVNVDAGVATGTILSNTATLSSATTDPNPGNNSATATTTVGSGSADLSVSKSDSPDPVTAGNNLTYTITVNNAGPSSATTAALADTLPTGTTFVSLSAPGGWSCTTPAVGATGTVNCSIPTLGVTSAVFTLVVNVDPAFTATLSNTATVSSATTDPNGGNESATALTTVATSADVSITKTDSPDPISAGSLLTYTLTIANAGPSDAQNVSVSDTVPAGTVYIFSEAPAGWNCATPGVGGTGTLTCTNPTLAAGATAVITMSVTVNAALPNGTIITNTATVATTTTDPSPGNNSATATTTVAPVTNFTATKTVSGVFVSGTTVTYTVVLTNNMGHTQGDNFGNEFADILPSGLALTGATATSGTILTVLPSNIVTWNGSIPNGGTVTITITATITAASGTISNQGNAIIDTDNSGNNETGLLTDDPSTAAVGDPTVFTIIPANTVSATKSVSGIFTPGSTVTYTIVVTNNMGIAQANNAGDELTDVLPPSLTLINATATSGTATPNVGTNTVTWNGSLAPGASVTITITAAINVGASGAVSNQANLAYDTDGNGSNEATGVSDDPSTGTANDPTVFNIMPPGEVSGTKSASGSFVPGGAITYTIVLTNNMGIAQANNPGDEFTDILPPSLTLVSATATSGTPVANVGTNTVTWNGSLAAGASVTITINATIDSDVAPGTTISNQGTISYDADGNGTNESTDQTDSASAPGSDDPTLIVVAAATLNHIPTLDQWALIALAMAMAAFAAMKLRA